MFEIVEKARSGPSIYVAGIGRRGGEALRDLHDSGTPGVTRYVVIEEQSADCTGCPPADSGFALSPDQADPSVLINLDEEEILEGETRLTCTPSDKLRAKIERAFRGADVILLIADMESRVGRSLGPDIAQLASDAAAITFGVAILSAGEDCTDAGAKEQLSRFITRARAGTLVSCGVPDAARGVGSAAQDVKATQATLTEIYACVARGFVEPLLWCQVFPDVRVALRDGGHCFIGWGSATGENRTQHAVEAAIAHTQLGINRLATARSALVTLRGRYGNLCKDEMREVIEVLAAAAGGDLWIMPSAVYDESVAERLHVSILAISGRTT